MKSQVVINQIFLFIILCVCISKNNLYAQDGFQLYPSGNSYKLMKYVPKAITVDGVNYVTGYTSLSAYLNTANQVYSDPGDPVQKLQLQGGNILLCRTQSSNTLNLNPTSVNGAILFGDIIQAPSGWIHGKWGIEYDNQSSTGGLNFFKPVSSLTSSRINFNLFIRNDGNVGIGTGVPLTKLHVQGDATVSNLANNAPKGENVVSSDANGKLVLVNKSLIADNMGNCVATQDLVLGSYLMIGSAGKELMYSPTGEPWREGLKFLEKSSGDLRLSSFTNASFTLDALVNENPENGNALYWASNARCGGYGFGLTNKDRIGGIFWDKDKPIPIMSFDALKIGIGCTPGNGKYRLYVKDGIETEEIVVKLSTEWGDYIFDKNYNLPTIKELESYISKNHHLPEIPNSEQIKSDGINLGEMNAILVKKVEELTLYIINQQKQIDELNKLINP